MKYKFLLISTFFLFVLSKSSSAQISNLMVNGSSTSFTMTSGDTLSWSYNLPTGSTATVEVWYDVNGNGTIEPATDIVWDSFTQTDGNAIGNNGPPDMDGQANGAISFKEPVGIAPGKYVMKFSQGGSSATIAGTVSPLPSPAHTISGTITVPAGASAANIFVEASRDGQYQPSFWDGVTDASGNYSIQMTADTAGGPWRVRIVNNPLPGSIVTPPERDIYVSGNPSGIDFSVSAAAAKVVGYLKDEGGNPIANNKVSISRLDSINTLSMVQYYGKTDANGWFALGIADSDLIAGRTWRLFANLGNGDTTGAQLAAVNEMTVNKGDSLFRNLVIYNANSTIQGTVKIDGAVPGISIEVIADNNDSAQAATMVDSATGNFTLHVTDKIFNYYVFPVFVPSNYSIPQTTAHPGDSGVMLNITSTAVRTTVNSLPKKFALGQNYPNPFNPTTTITYDVSSTSLVTITVYNILGQKVAVLVDGMRSPGAYKVTFNGSRLASGLYLYRMSAGGFSSVRKLVLMK